MLPEGARPSPPASWAARSLMMSPKRLLVTMTSNWLGSRMSSMARVSMKRWRESISGYSARTDLKTRCQRSPAKVMALDLSDMQRRSGLGEEDRVGETLALTPGAQPGVAVPREWLRA